MTLPQAPAQVVGADGIPRMGRYSGLAQGFDWAALAPPYARTAWWRRFHHKRWHYVALAGGDLFCAVAIVDLGWISTAFAYVFSRADGRLIAEFSQDGLPGIGGARLADDALGSSSFRMLSNRIALEADGAGGHVLTLRCGALSIDARIGSAAPVLLAVGAVAGGSVHATQKSGAQTLNGLVRVGEQRHVLDGGVASYDYSNGLLARDTAWRWASAHGPGLGFNLQAGYFGANENALWIDGRIIALGEAEFLFDPRDALAPWRIRTVDGLLDLEFTPEGMRAEDKNLLVAASRYVQPIGTFNGVVRTAPGAPPVDVRQLAGVTEDHHSRW
jgi:hypothetical protein